ncbi:ribonucleoside-diphosphate reductase subunit alpha [Bryobacter aggregatus]|uniref:ribonucleoside-diphosphate reductase subunit alpha n=1 Tax=Bryobacter aggregatus TaxID=360054 RepID=UPI0004E1A229|nr:ribonucleoside-diphosphate reductase subunit alpha [Bryobacter aggregatus]
MRVRKRNGSFEAVSVDKIIRAVERSSVGLKDVDPMRVATNTIGGLFDGSTTKDLDSLSIQTAASLIAEEPEYSRLAARLLVRCIEKEVQNQNVFSFSQSIEAGFRAGLIAETTATFVRANARKLNAAIDDLYSDRFEFFGIRTVYDRYLLKDPVTREVIETPQYFFLRVACGLSENVPEAVGFYRLLGALEYLPSSPTLFNSGTTHSQMSSCFLLDSPEDNLDSIYDRYKDIARLSKFAGGVGLAYHRIRSRGSLIRGTNGQSNGIVPWLKTLDSSVLAVNQGGKRKGACCVYLEPWHADIEEFLELRENTGDEARRTYNLNLAHWVPDLFMERVETDGPWSLFDPARVPEFPDLYGEAFRKAYLEAEAAGKYERQMQARDLYSRMMRTLAETGNGWMTFKDACNQKSNQTLQPQNVIHLSNLCTEITEVTSQSETAVCNLGSVNLARHVTNGAFDFEKLAATVASAVPFLDRVIDINFYPTDTAAVSNRRWRPVGLGIMGLQDVFFQLKLAFASEEARRLSTQIQEEIYFHALSASCSLAEMFGPHPSFAETRAAVGDLQFDAWGIAPNDPTRWDALRQRIQHFGLRNSLLIAIAPTATIASIAGCYECIEPQISNLFKRETLSGDFIQVNRYLAQELKALGLWTEDLRNRLKLGEGSVQRIEEVPAGLREVYRTVWEVPMRSLIDLAAERGAFIDQSQSLNLFLESPTIGKLSSMYMYAWKKGLKTTYYLRSRPASKIAKTTVSAPSAARAVACSLESPESCEACQ